MSNILQILVVCALCYTGVNGFLWPSIFSKQDKKRFDSFMPTFEDIKEEPYEFETINIKPFDKFEPFEPFEFEPIKFEPIQFEPFSIPPFPDIDVEKIKTYKPKANEKFVGIHKTSYKVSSDINGDKKSSEGGETVVNINGDIHHEVTGDLKSD